MATRSETPEHAEIKRQIVAACRGLGLEANEEVRVLRRRADVLAIQGSEKIVFEVQWSKQSLKTILERQSQYSQNGMKGCWFYQKPLPKRRVARHQERPDLPLFHVARRDEGYIVSLVDNRKESDLANFVQAYLKDEVRFCEVVRAKPTQAVRLCFFEMPCWKCKETNHIYYVDGPFVSACNFGIGEFSGLWDGSRQEFRPEILAAVQKLRATPEGAGLHLGDIKPRASKTVEKVYLSFGCCRCDSIFGDWFVHDATMEAIYGKTLPFDVVVQMGRDLVTRLPHWCYPENGMFCDSVQPLA